MDALLADLESQLPKVWGRQIYSIFIGGGTPSLFPGVEIERLLSGVRALLPLSPSVEITIEANPGAADVESFSEYRRAGVNRLSIGVQSFNDQQLKLIGRVHSGDEALSAVKMARQVGFENINIDLMFGLPEQTQRQALADLLQGIELGVEHLSWYQLTLEPNTHFGHTPPHTLPQDEEVWQMQQEGKKILSGAGLKQYEVSAYCRDSIECYHNLNYWHFGDYLGVGAGAHGKITDVATSTIERTTRSRSPERYLAEIEQQQSVHSESVEDEDVILEFMLNQLRLKDPFTQQQFEERSGRSWSVVEDKIKQASIDGLLEVEPESAEDIGSRGVRVKVSVHGENFLNDLLSLFS